MSDLIRKSDVIKLINCFSFSLYKEQDYKIKKVLKEYIEKMPTAYSVDDVVKELEHTCDFIQSYKLLDECENFCLDKEIKMIRIDNAIKIVKAGGKHDD